MLIRCKLHGCGATVADLAICSMGDVYKSDIDEEEQVRSLAEVHVDAV